MENGKFRCFWSLGTGWGTVEIKPDRVMIRVQYGKLAVNTLKLPSLKGRALKTISINGDEVEFEVQNGQVKFTETILVKEDQKLVVALGL